MKFLPLLLLSLIFFVFASCQNVSQTKTQGSESQTPPSQEVLGDMMPSAQEEIIPVESEISQLNFSSSVLALSENILSK